MVINHHESAEITHLVCNITNLWVEEQLFEFLVIIATVR